MVVYLCLCRFPRVSQLLQLPLLLRFNLLALGPDTHSALHLLIIINLFVALWTYSHDFEISYFAAACLGKPASIMNSASKAYDPPFLVIATRSFVFMF